MALDDHDQLQNDNGKIDVGGMWACMETRGKMKGVVGAETSPSPHTQKTHIKINNSRIMWCVNSHSPVPET